MSQLQQLYKPLILAMFYSAPSEAPQNISAKIMGPASIVLSWQPPPVDQINGVLRNFHITVQSTTDFTMQHDDLVDHETIEHSLVGLHPNYQYICNVSATTIEEGPPAYIQIQMPEDGEH